MKLICFRHSDYDGTTSPTLSCKTCCSIFIAAIKKHNDSGDAGQVDTYKWLEHKAEEGRNAYMRIQKQAPAAADQTTESLLRFGFNPFTI